MDDARELPRKVVGAGMLLRDASYRVLLVEPTYKERWEVPGGVVEAFEPPLAAAKREVREELGLEIDPVGLLVIDWSPPRPECQLDIENFIFDGGQLTREQVAQIQLQEAEVASYRFFDLCDRPALVGGSQWFLAGRL